jgi:large subunit ribosomal protein L1
MAKHSRRYRELASKAPQEAVSLEQAVKVLKGYGNTKFDQTVEIHVRLGIDPKQADQLVRGSVVLPHGIGRTQRVVVFAKGDLAEAAKAAGADLVGQEDLATKIKDGWTDFDVCIATPDMMGMVGPLGRVLGPRGLMPSPRAGNDSGGNVHAVVGKISFDAEKLTENIRGFLDFLQNIKPNAIKGTYIRGVFLATTMGPGIQIAA